MTTITNHSFQQISQGHFLIDGQHYFTSEDDYADLQIEDFVDTILIYLDARSASGSHILEYRVSSDEYENLGWGEILDRNPIAIH